MQGPSDCTALSLGIGNSTSFLVEVGTVGKCWLILKPRTGSVCICVWDAVCSWGEMEMAWDTVRDKPLPRAASKGCLIVTPWALWGAFL